MNRLVLESICTLSSALVWEWVSFSCVFADEIFQRSVRISPLSRPRRLSSPRSSTLPRSHSTKDSWLLGETWTLHADDLPWEHLAASFPWHFLSVSKWNGKCESVDSDAAAFHCWVGRWNVWNVTACTSVRSYSTVYTMFPVFSLVLDKDVKSEVAMLYPELYKDLLKVFDN